MGKKYNVHVLAVRKTTLYRTVGWIALKLGQGMGDGTDNEAQAFHGCLLAAGEIDDDASAADPANGA
jgi:hypothetical protein